MGYIVKSSLDFSGKIVPWNEKEVQKLIKDKEEKLEKQIVEEPIEEEEKKEEEIIQEEEAVKKEDKIFKENKKPDKKRK